MSDLVSSSKEDKSELHLVIDAQLDNTPGNKFSIQVKSTTLNLFPNVNQCTKDDRLDSIHHQTDQTSKISAKSLADRSQSHRTKDSN